MPLKNNLKALRLKAKLTQRQMTEAAGINTSAASRIEKLNGVPCLEGAMRLAVVLKCSIEDIWPNPFVLERRTITSTINQVQEKKNASKGK